MVLMEWDEMMSVGVEELDSQHRRLIQLINETYEGIQQHDERKVTELITQMREYSKLHFSTEEKFMERYGYPDLEEHKFYHVKFNTDVQAFQRKQYGKTNLSQLFIYLSRWLTSHIMEEDRKFMRYMSKKEIE